MAAVSPAWSCGASPGGAPCGGAGQASLGNDSSTNQGAGNPINVLNGNKFQPEVDLPALPGVLGLEIVRYYNSAYAGIKTPNGIMGRGWRLSYETNLYAIHNSIQIVQADGTRIIFSRDASHPDLCATNNPSQGKVLIAHTMAGEEYTWIWADGRRLSFDRGGKLEQIVAPTGEFVSLQYDTQEHLIQVTDPEGRRLHLDYSARATGGTTERFQGVQSIDSPVGRFGYEYGSAPTLSAFPAAVYLANLVRVTQPVEAGNSGSISHVYSYEDPRYPSFLTGISVSGVGSDGRAFTQRLGTYRYDRQGRGVLSVKGIPRQLGKSGQIVPGSGIDQVNLDYSQPGRTRLTNSLGQTTQYDYKVINGNARLLEERGAGCSTCNDTNVRYRYDALGQMVLVTHLAPDGTPIQATQTMRDEWGRPVRISTIAYLNGHAQPAQIRARYEYSGESDQPALIAQPSVIPGREHQIHISYNTTGQPTEVSETGWAPGLAGTQPIALVRTETYRYSRINGRSLLTEFDGPLPDGPTHSPADSDITRYQWDAGGNYVVAVTRPGSLVSTLQYDTVGRIAAVSDAQGYTTRFTYDSRNQITRVTHNGLNWPQADIDPIVQIYRYDTLGNRIETGRGSGKTYLPQTREAFDVGGRLLWQAEALGILKSASYDTEGHLLRSTVQTSRFEQTERYRYDDLNRLIQVVDNTGTVHKVTYDQPHPADVDTRSASLTIRDDFGREVEVSSVSLGTIDKRYNVVNQLIEQSNARGDVQTYTYNLKGQRTSYTLTPKNGKPQTTTWRYSKNRVIEINDPAQTERIRYNERGWPASKAVTLKLAHGAVATYTTRYRYNEDGSLQSQSLADGTELIYERNGQGQVVAVARQSSSWIRYGWGKMTLVKDIERDLIGLNRLTYGNGIQGRWQRSREGVLARVVYTQPDGRTTAPLRAARTLTGMLENLLPVAHAQPEPLHPGKLPGALGIPSNPQALLDTRLLYDEAGDVLLQQQQGRGPQRTQAYAYDGRHELIAAQTPRPAMVWRYYYDRQGNRLLAQDNVPVSDLGHTRKARYNPFSNALITPSDRGREYVWNAQGQLIAIRQGSHELAHYRYNYRGLRVSKEIGAQTEYTLYNDQRQRMADLDGRGRITRQYIWLGDKLIATLDPEEPIAPSQPASGFRAALAQAVHGLWSHFTGRTERIAFIHTNYLGAPIAATDRAGELLWQADYAPYGELVQTVAKANTPTAYTLALRFPGQWDDAESGLYYNDLRYYDAHAGRYLSPDPLGLLAAPFGSANAYAYVDNNPTSYIDPLGLMLFAFDGTNNADQNNLLPGRSVTNVVDFYNTYNQTTNDPAYYITGIGTVNPQLNQMYVGNIYTGDGFVQRLGYATTDLQRFIETNHPASTINIDVVGFSRGAAEARAWVNQILSSTQQGQYTFTGNNQSYHACINFRFEGLWDTVPHLGLSNQLESQYDFSIPPQVQYAVQAVALNENRGGPANFNAYSIMPTPGTPNSATRIEQGLIGEHSDIGGGLTTGDLSNVAFTWMYDQAQRAGVPLNGEPVNLETVNSPILHNNDYPWWPAGRTIRYGNGTTVAENAAVINSPGGSTPSHAWSQQFITLHHSLLVFPPCSNDTSIVGMVDMNKYGAWLASNGINVTSSQPTPATQLCH